MTTPPLSFGVGSSKGLGFVGLETIILDAFSGYNSASPHMNRNLSYLFEMKLHHRPADKLHIHVVQSFIPVRST